MNGFSTEEDSHDGPPGGPPGGAPGGPPGGPPGGCGGQSCCLLEDALRCGRPAGNASFSKRIQKSISQKKLKLDIDKSRLYADVGPPVGCGQYCRVSIPEDFRRREEKRRKGGEERRNEERRGGVGEEERRGGEVGGGEEERRGGGGGEERGEERRERWTVSMMSSRVAWS
ncbi:hypothetical protein CRUP_032702 [Coryphaenoides rupestris]|nr:hypothetical protein CRUP_032702 [Coryphaenoides rupestris]